MLSVYLTPNDVNLSIIFININKMTLIYVLFENYFRQRSVEIEYLLFLDRKLTMHVYSTALMVMEHKKIKTVLKWKNDRKKFKICSLSSKVTVGVAKKPWTIWNGKLLLYDWFFSIPLTDVLFMLAGLH